MCALGVQGIPQNPPYCRPEEKTADEFFNNIDSNPPCGTAARLS
ncbi:hypothetical protein DFO80_14413 [Rhodobacter sp. 140A]|nr:hypothetical protein DFO80_14413 [Rhodobacter sp. 140A]